MRIRSKKISNLENKVTNYINELVVNYLNTRGYECNSSIKSMVNINNFLKSQYKKVLVIKENEKMMKIGSYYTWEAIVKIKIIDTITGKEI